MTNIWTNRFIDKWTRDKIRLSPPATINSIIETEEILGFQFPLDFKELYLRVDGFADWDWTEICFQFGH
jgi:cell wall assembly regulator SMI1